MMRFFTVFSVCVMMAAPLWAIGVPNREIPVSTLVGLSDLIILGTVISVEETIPPLDRRSTVYEENLIKGVARVRIDETLRGVAAGTEVSIAYQIVPPWIAPGAPQERPRYNTQRIFLLQRSRQGYSVLAGSGIRTLDARNAVVDAITAIPLDITILTPVGPCYFGQPTAVKVRVRNISEKPITIMQPQLAGFYYTRAIGIAPVFLQGDRPAPPPPVAIANAPVPVPPAGVPPPPVSFALEGNAEQIVTLTVRCAEPQELMLFGADSYLMLPLSLRATVSTMPDRVPGKVIEGPVISHTYASPWVDVLAGYPPPKSDGE